MFTVSRVAGLNVADLTAHGKRASVDPLQRLVAQKVHEPEYHSGHCHRERRAHQPLHFRPRPCPRRVSQRGPGRDDKLDDLPHHEDRARGPRFIYDPDTGEVNK